LSKRLSPSAALPANPLQLLLLSQLALFWNFAFRRFAGRRQGGIECAQRKLASCECAAHVAVDAQKWK
jgi:hypothetical protein